MKYFLSCDWGTSSFRLRLIEVETAKVAEEEKNSEGIAKTFELWKQSGKNEELRLHFYLDIILKYIDLIEKRSNFSLDNIPLIISGMASSSIGMINLGYKKIPFSAEGEDLEIHVTEPNKNFRHKTLITSGVSTENDVMRGEETQLIGCASAHENDQEYMYIFPGTHSKHIKVKNGLATDFKTYMTGEFFELLSKKSILSVSVAKDEKEQDDAESFTKGVKESLNSNLLHSCFSVRTNDLFKKISPAENYFFLSGLIIGTELKDLKNETQNITIVGNTVLNAQYMRALQVIDFSEKKITIKTIDADEALIKGQLKIYKNVFKMGNNF